MRILNRFLLAVYPVPQLDPRGVVLNAAMPGIWVRHFEGNLSPKREFINLGRLLMALARARRDQGDSSAHPVKKGSAIKAEPNLKRMRDEILKAIAKEWDMTIQFEPKGQIEMFARQIHGYTRPIVESFMWDLKHLPKSQTQHLQAYGTMLQTIQRHALIPPEIGPALPPESAVRT